MTKLHKPQDPELENKVQRALGLRITLGEICDRANINRVNLYRWRYTNSPRYADRQALLDNIDGLIEERMAEYSSI